MVVWTQIEVGGSTTIHCPYCKRHKKIIMPHMEGMDSDFRIKTKCTCGKSFYLATDKRKHPRKNTNLTGGYFHVRREYRGLITIKSLSESGAGIELNTERRMLKHDKLIIKFNLDDERKAYVEKEAKIKRTDGLEFGLEFVKDMPESDPLYLYLHEAEENWH